jgi:hypothetical protein
MSMKLVVCELCGVMVSFFALWSCVVGCRVLKGEAD